ncbi:photosystem II stability/assembly factor-like protein [Echinicola marina]|uniref:WD40/YVTN/BNR-like repeat-containing protein n=1 Tax=Echinicola marina TaxID=2859768 RepID=UPI001CF63328|nr:YCF48-related protein [Echinicola marina]UCS94396.1 photosystem II stability/assembly factor-like protein [Echinicola marina]
MRNIFYLLFLSIIASTLISSCQSPKAHEITTPLGWEIVDTPTKSSIRGLCPLTEDIAWATGSNGLWMLTVDGGKTWEHGVIDGLDTVDFRDIEAFNAKTAIAISAGQPAVIYRTSNAGKTWKKTYEGPKEAFLDGLSFDDDKKGFVYGDPVNGKLMVLQTFNGGKSWITLSTTPELAKGEAGFAASGSGILTDNDKIWIASGGTKSQVYYSENAGVDWTNFPVPIIQGEASQGIFSMSFIKEGTLVAVGGDYKKPDDRNKNIALSIDHGKTWKSPTGKGPSGYRSGVAYFPKEGWLIAVGTNGSDYSTDGGNNWAKFSDQGPHAVKLSKNEGTIWISGADGMIGKIKY